MTLHPNIIAGALREAAVLVNSSHAPFDVGSAVHRQAYTETFEFLVRTVLGSEALADAAVEVVVGEFASPAPAPNPGPPPQMAPPAPQAAPQPAPAQYAPAQYAAPTPLPQQAPPPPASVSPNSSEDELWASLISEFQTHGRLVSWEDKRQRKGPNGRGADFAHTQIQKQGKDGKWWPMGLWLNNRTPGWVLPALQQVGLA